MQTKDLKKNDFMFWLRRVIVLRMQRPKPLVFNKGNMKHDSANTVPATIKDAATVQKLFFLPCILVIFSQISYTFIKCDFTKF